MVFSIDDSLYGSTQHLYTIAVEHPSAMQLHPTVECCLSAKRQQDAVRPFFLDDTFHKFRLYGLEIHLICHPF